MSILNQAAVESLLAIVKKERTEALFKQRILEAEIPYALQLVRYHRELNPAQAKVVTAFAEEAKTAEAFRCIELIVSLIIAELTDLPQDAILNITDIEGYIDRMQKLLNGYSFIMQTTTVNDVELWLKNVVALWRKHSVFKA